MKEVIASLEHVCKYYGQKNNIVRALDNVSLELYKSEFTAIVGASGSGKSTLLHCLVGLDNITSGKIVVAGKELVGMNDSSLTKFRREHVGFVFQAFNLLPSLNVEENILLPLLLAHRKFDKVKVKKVAELLGLEERLKHLPSELSGGQQQRVALARALIMQNDILVCDEPTGNLDTKSSSEVMHLLRSAVDELKQTVIVVTHDRKIAAMADRVIAISDGKVYRDFEYPEQAELAEVI